MILILSLIVSLFSTGYEGSWKGSLNVQGTNLPVVFHIAKNDSGFVTTMDSPNQGAYGIPAASTVVEKDKVTISFPNMAASYVGTLNENKITGKWSQGGLTLDLNLIRDKKSKPPISE